MKLFKKLDNYLLHYYPTIWITRIHSFLPIGLGIAAILFLITVLIGWNPKDPIPNSAVTLVLMIIPVLIYLVYWFVFQSRYNIAKSGVTMPYSFEYLNFFCYMLVFFTAFLIIAAIPLANYQKVKNAIDPEVFEVDLKNLDAGNTLINQSSEVVFNSDGTISFYENPYAYDTYNSFNFDYYDFGSEVYQSEFRTVSRSEAEQLIANYIKSYNKFTRYPMTQTSSELLADIESGDYTYYYYDDYGYQSDWEVHQKISQLQTSLKYGWYFEFSSAWFWKIYLGLMAFLAMLVWIFKQMKLRQFVFGFIALCLTPLFIAIVGVVLFEILRIRQDEEEIVSGIILLVYFILAIISFSAFRKNTLSNFGYVSTLYLHFFLPLLPIFVWLFFFDNQARYMFNREVDLLDFFYWSGWFVGLCSIAAFKPLYAKFRSLPSKN